MIYHGYSDEKQIKNKIPTYSIEEILAEKIRAFFQRSYPAPRDFYDVWYICRNVEISDWNRFSSLFFQKMKIKKQQFDIGLLEDQSIINKVNKAWYNSLGNHMNPEVLPKTSEVFSFLFSFLKDKLKE